METLYHVKKATYSGANPNLQDNWGQNPLHVVISAYTKGAFHIRDRCSLPPSLSSLPLQSTPVPPLVPPQILTNNPKTDVNLKSNGGNDDDNAAQWPHASRPATSEASGRKCVRNQRMLEGQEYKSCS